MEKSLKKSIEEHQLFQSYPMAFLGLESVENDSEALDAFYNAVRLLRKIDSSKKDNKLPKFYEVIDEDDFIKLKMFLTERLFVLLAEEKNKIETCEHKRIRENTGSGRFDECLDCGKTWG